MIHSKKRITLISVILLALVALAVVTVLRISANERFDAMIDIRAAFDEKYKVGESYLLKDDGYIGTEVELTTYYDYETFGAAKPVLKGTNAALYFVNTNTERVGRESDVNIISDLLSRGFAVVTVDYFGDSLAKGQALDWSSQEVRKSVINGACFTDKTVFPSGTYKDTYVLPAGYNVTPFATFWSIDEHGADGTFDRIVEVWNNDFRGVKGSVVVNWTRTEIGASGEEITVQKATQTGLDGTAPQWYSDASGKNPVDKDSPDAKYIKIKHTLAETITDCTAKDGSPMSLDLEMHIVYPVDPENTVPVIMQSGSSEYLTTGKTGTDTRPQHNGYLFRGYAGVIYDHIYVPMAHDLYYGYFDGSKDAAVTGDHASYTLYFLNNTKFDTAAVRYVKYLALTEPEKYGFDTESIGVYGNSKGGMFMFLGSAELSEYTEIQDGMTLAESIDARINAYETNRYAVGHHGETRYGNGLTEDYTVGNYTIRAGKLQPWTTYVDQDGVEREILSDVAYMYTSSGNVASMKEGHAPLFSAICLNDPLGNGYTSANQVVAAAKTLDVACMSFVVNVGHTFTYGNDVYYGVDTYDAMFDFSDYYLKGSAVKVIYTSPVVSSADIDTASPITIKFSGAVSRAEIDKITLCDSVGNAVSGIIWESSFGGTEWKLIHAGLLGGEEYTLTIPEGFAGENGAPTTETFTASYRTRAEGKLSPTAVKTALGTYVTVEKTDSSLPSGAKLRFLVENDAANTVSVYEVASFDVSDPDASVIGNKIATVNLYGRGVYECDVSDTMANASMGEGKTFLLKTDKETGVFNVLSQNFGSSVSKLGNAQFSVAELSFAPDNTAAAKVHITTNTRADGTSNYVNSHYYPSMYTVLNNSGLFPKITASDLGRKYTVSLKVFDTVSREINLKLSGATNATHKILDFDYTYFTVYTKANEWTEISFEYTVLNPLYGSTALTTKSLTVSLAGDGDKESPIYISELSVTERVTEAFLSDIHIALYNDGTTYKAPTSDKPFSIGSIGYDSLSSALSAAKSGDTVTANASYTVTEAFAGLEKLSAVTLDLSGYKLYVKDSLFSARATATPEGDTRLTVKNGAVYIGDSALVNYSGSSSAGSGKTFAFNFENVKFIATDLDMAKKLISESKVSSARDITVSFSFDECDFRIEKEKLTRNPVTLFPGAEGELDVSYTLSGGKIILDTSAWVTLWDSYVDANIVTLDDGNQYYHITIPMPASEAARNVVLKATVTVGGKDFNGTWTMSIPKYSMKVLASDANETEKTLVKDVLSYIKASYVYFDTEDKTEVVNAIDEILGDYKNTFAKVEGNTDADDGLWGVVIVLEEKPAVRFVLPEGVTADGYTFKSGNTTLEYTVGTMNIGENTHYYTEVSLFAYQMINEITYTDGTNSGTWHINSYYDFVTTDDEFKSNENLVRLVEKLYNYCKSAEAYRALVTNK